MTLLPKHGKKGRSLPQPTLNLKVQALHVDFLPIAPYTQHSEVGNSTTINVLADTGCQSCLAGPNLLNKLGLPRSALLKVTTKMRGAGNTGINPIPQALWERDGRLLSLIISNDIHYRVHRNFLFKL